MKTKWTRDSVPSYAYSDGRHEADTGKTYLQAYKYHTHWCAYVSGATYEASEWGHKTLRDAKAAAERLAALFEEARP